MDKKLNENFRFHNLDQINRNGYFYDYTKNGILKKCMPDFIWGANQVLVSFLQLIDIRLIMLFNYIDKLKHFKNFYK
jgi:hypothetical protein